MEGSCLASACPAGQYNHSNVCAACHATCATCANATATGCLSCPVGLSVLHADGSCAAACPAGQYNHSNVCAACLAGFFCATDGTQAPVACPVAHYCPAGSINATLCDAGAYCNATVLSAVAGVCGAGFFCPNGSAAMTACTAGAFCAGTVRVRANKIPMDDEGNTTD